MSTGELKCNLTKLLKEERGREEGEGEWRGREETCDGLAAILAIWLIRSLLLEPIHIFVFFWQIFVGNDDSKTIAVRHLKHPITARYVRIHPLAWYGVHICMRAELYGCDHLGQSLQVLKFV